MSLLCQRFEHLVVSDLPEDRQRLATHAAECRPCGRRLAAHDELARRVASWKAVTPAPRVSLGTEVLAVVAAEHRQREIGVPTPERRPPAAGPSCAEKHAPAHRVSSETADSPRSTLRRSAAWLAVAALLLVSTLIAHRTSRGPAAPEQADRLLVVEALEEAIAAERAHARALARLERAAAPILARADDLSLPPQQAALLLSYRDRLAFLDQAIAEINAFLEDNAAHSGARSLLLAAYNEKTEFLRRVLAREEEPTS